MKFEEIELNNYIGLYQGTLKTNVKIKFGYNRITMITGPNGSGKSTLLEALSIYPDSNACFITGQPASKRIILNDGGKRYKIDFIHGVTEKGVRATAKAYIKKEENGQWIEQNATGTINSYKDYIEGEFDLDPNFVSLATLSAENKGFVEMTPAERKKYVNAMIAYVEVYNNIHKVLNKRSSVYKSLINSLVSKIDLIGNEEQLLAELNKLSSNIESMKKDKSKIEDILATNKAQIKILDPDSSIQNVYNAVHVELEQYKSSITQYQSDLDYLYSSSDKSPIERLSLNDLSKLYSEISSQERILTESCSSLESDLNKKLQDREEQSRALQLKQSRIDSLSSEFDYQFLIDSIKANEKSKSEYEKIFNDIHIKNAIEISKDEYILGLNTMNDIKDMIKAIQSSHFIDDINFTLSCIEGKVNISKLIEEKEHELDQSIAAEDELNKQYSYYSGLLDSVKILSDRPSKCKIDSCPFISSSLAAQKEEPEKKLMKLESEIKEKTAKIKKLSEELTSLKSCQKIDNMLSIVLRNIENSKSILSKLPYGDLFLNRKKFFDDIRKGASFDDIAKLYEYINIANIFEEYKKVIDILKSLSSEKKIYDEKQRTLDELMNDFNDINSKLDSILKDIDNYNNQIQSKKNEIIELGKVKELLDKIIIIQRGYEEALDKINECNKKLETVSNNMNQIQQCLDLVKESENHLSGIESLISELEEQKNGIRYSLGMLKQYTEEMKQYQDSYSTIEVIKEYSSPTKKGIQNLFIKVYMAQTLKLANELLALFFNNRLNLLPYDIQDNKFAIPCFSNFSGLVTDDVSSCSRSEKAMIELAMSGSLLMQGSSKFNIFRCDELDEGLDAGNRLQFTKAINMVCDILNIEQFIMISHSSELALQNVDIIKLKEGMEINGIDSANVICSL